MDTSFRVQEIAAFVKLHEGHKLDKELLRLFRLFTEDPKAKIRISGTKIIWSTRGCKVTQTRNIKMLEK